MFSTSKAELHSNPALGRCEASAFINATSTTWLIMFAWADQRIHVELRPPTRLRPVLAPHTHSVMRSLRHLSEQKGHPNLCLLFSASFFLPVLLDASSHFQAHRLICNSFALARFHASIFRHQSPFRRARPAAPRGPSCICPSVD